MEVRVLKEALQEALTELNRTAPAQSGVPICSHVLLATEAGRLTATATNLEVVVKAYIGGQIETEGSCTVPAGKLARILARIKADEALTIKVKRKITTFDMEGRTFTLQGENAADFPPIPGEFDRHGEVYGGELKDRLNRTAFCALKHEDRPVLHTVLLEAEGETLTVTAADGHRLGTFTLPYKGDDFEANVPLSVVAALVRLLPDDVVGVHVGGSVIRFTLRNYDVTGQLVQGTYPDYQRLIPDGCDLTVTVQRDALQSEVETAMVLASDGSGIIRLHAEEGGLRVVAKSEAVGNYSATIPATIRGAYSGKVALNGRYILDVLKAMEPGPVSLDWRPGHPVRFTQGDDGLYILMPMVVSWGED